MNTFKHIDIKFDMSDFQSKFKKVIKESIPEALKKGMGKAVLELYGDTLRESPTVPVDESTLRGSGSCFVGKESINTSAVKSANGITDTSQETQDHSEPIGKDEIVGIVGFNTPYATRWHEVPANFQEPGSGNKYLEDKLIKNRQKYMFIIAESCRKESERR